MAKMDKKILDELARFNNLSHNANNLTAVAGVANLGMGSHIARLAKKFNIDMSEQEDVETDEEDLDIPLDPEAETAEVGDEEIALDDEEIALDDEEIDLDDTGLDEPVSDSTELDVTDLVKKDEEISDSLEAQKDILSKNTEGLDDLMSKLNDLEQHLSSMDTMVSKISDLENKIETLRPKTEQEKMDLRKYDSGPFNNTLTDFFVDKQEVFDKTGKKEYILTPEEVENYNETEIKNSFRED